MTSARLGALAVVVAVGAALVVAQANLSRIPALLDWVRAQGALAPLAYGVMYALAVPLCVPGSVLTLMAGALFGLWPGVPVVFLAALVGSSLSFLVARYAARPSVEAWARRYPRFGAVDRAVASEGARIVFLLRLTPLVPFTVLNYLLGVTRLRWRDLVVASPGMLPGTLLYVYYGHVIGDVTAVATGARPPRSVAQYVLLAAGLVAAGLVAWRVSQLASRALRDSRLDPPPQA